MKMRLMIKIDRLIGVPVCFFLAIFQLIESLVGFKETSVKDIEKVLIIKFLGIGSISLAIPTISALKSDFPQAKIYFLTFESNKEVLEILNSTYKNFFISTNSPFSFLISTIKTIIQIRKEKIDLVLDLEFFAKFPLILSFFAGIRKKAGFNLGSEWWRKYLLDFHGFYNHYYHVKDIFLSLAYLVKHKDPYYRTFDRYQKEYTLPILPLNYKILQKVTEKLRKVGVKDNKEIIVINPNSGPELAPHLKRWPPEHFAQLIERINRKYSNLSIVLIGSKSEKLYVQSIIDKTNNTNVNTVINFAGETTLIELLGVLSMSNIFISVDSGPMHLASLIRIPTIGLFGAETPTLYAPLNERAIVLCKNLYSVPMFTVYNGKQSNLTENIPLQLISVDEVYENVEKFLSKNPILCIASFVNHLILEKSE